MMYIDLSSNKGRLSSGGYIQTTWSTYHEWGRGFLLPFRIQTLLHRRMIARRSTLSSFHGPPGPLKPRSLSGSNEVRVTTPALKSSFVLCQSPASLVWICRFTERESHRTCLFSFSICCRYALQKSEQPLAARIHSIAVSRISQQISIAVRTK